MNKEKIKLSKHIQRSIVDENYTVEEGYNENEDLGFKFIEEEIIYTDLKKAYTTSAVIIQRNLDNKFFKFTYDNSEYCTFNEINSDCNAYEVFPKVITKTIYE